MILGICGSGGAAREVYELAFVINEKYHKWNKIVFLAEIINDDLFKDFDVIPLQDALECYRPEEIEYIVSYGEPYDRKRIADKICDSGNRLATLISPYIHIPANTVIEDGVIIDFNTYISNAVTIRRNVYLHPNVVVGHDTILEDSCVIGANSVVPGNCSIGQQAFLGSNVTVKERTRIGELTIISMGAVVRHNIPDNMVVAGECAKVIAENRFRKIFHL